MIILLYGKDSFRGRRQLRKMMDKFKTDRDPDGFNTVRIDARTEPDKLLQHLLTPAFLAEKRMVVVENLLASKEKELQVEVLQKIEQKAIPDTSVIVFWEGAERFKAGEAKRLLARLQQEKYVQKFDPLIGAKLTAWMEEQIKELGGRASKHALFHITRQVNSDTWHARSLIEQLAAYKQGQEIELKDVHLFMEEKADDNIFNLVDAIVGKQTKNVYAMIQEQYRQGKDAQYVFAMILRQFRILIQLRDLYDREDVMQSAAMAAKVDLHPFVVKKSLPFVKRYSLEQLKYVYQELLDLDTRIKTGSGRPGLLLDLFVARICAA